MLEQIDLHQSLPKDEYKRRLPLLQSQLYDLEHRIFEARIPVAIVFEGWAAAGKGSTINLLSERLDPRGFRVVPVLAPRTAETHFPWLHRFWLRIPAYGQIVVYDTSWYRRVLIDRVRKSVPKQEWRTAYQDIVDFERQLADDGTIILKFWMHIGRKEQARRFKKLLRDKLTAWQVTEEDLAQHKFYRKYRVAVEDMLSRTDAPHAPWIVVEATDRCFTRIKVLETIVKSLDERLAARVSPAAAPKPRRPHRA